MISGCVLVWVQTQFLLALGKTIGEKTNGMTSNGERTNGASTNGVKDNIGNGDNTSLESNI
jgi:hypothetical protein